MISSRLTDIAGSSTVFDRGFVTYSNEAKIEMLSVEKELLKKHGAVSENVACAMATGALVAAPKANLSLSVTGIAGPNGDSPEKPIGLVHFSCHCKNKLQRHKKHIFSGNRDEIRQKAVETALSMILKELS